MTRDGSVQNSLSLDASFQRQAGCAITEYVLLVLLVFVVGAPALNVLQGSITNNHLSIAGSLESGLPGQPFSSQGNQATDDRIGGGVDWPTWP